MYMNITGRVGGYKFLADTYDTYMYMYINRGGVGLKFRHTLMYTNDHVFHQLMCVPPPGCTAGHNEISI